MDRTSPSSHEQATTRFGLRHEDGRWWLLPPEGRPFFSLGVCVLDQGTLRERYDEANPSYAAWRHDASPNEWADASLARLNSWGFTTIGGWSDYAVLRRSREQKVGMTPVLNIGAHVGAPWLDMWDETLVARMDAIAREQIEALRGEDRVIGYYSDNELGWWNATLPLDER